jgi:hypothetical protein
MRSAAPESKDDAVLCGDVDDCWHCFARQALEQVP